MKTSKFVARIGAIGASVSAAAAALTASAQGTGVLNVPSVGNLREQEIGPLILDVIEAGLLVAGSVAVLFLIVGGFLYITAAGDEQRLEKAKLTLKNAIVGTIFILLALVIVLTIEQFLG